MGFKEGSELYKTAYYGNSKFKTKNSEFDVPLILDLMEGLLVVSEIYENRRNNS
jgi:hypothetical protein